MSPALITLDATSTSVTAESRLDNAPSTGGTGEDR